MHVRTFDAPLGAHRRAPLASELRVPSRTHRERAGPLCRRADRQPGRAGIVTVLAVAVPLRPVLQRGPRHGQPRDGLHIADVRMLLTRVIGLLKLESIRFVRMRRMMMATVEVPAIER